MNGVCKSPMNWKPLFANANNPKIVLTDKTATAHSFTVQNEGYESYQRPSVLAVVVSRYRAKSRCCQ
jgi:hypothetical protein